jgi:hypothetical protein
VPAGTGFKAYVTGVVKKLGEPVVEEMPRVQEEILEIEDVEDDKDDGDHGEGSAVVPGRTSNKE